MKKSHKANGCMRALISVILALALPFQVFAYAPPVIFQSLPDAVAGIFYQQQLFAAGTNPIIGQKGFAWSADGLPAGMEIDSANGMIFGTPTASGEFKILVTVHSRWRLRFTKESKHFLLRVLPPPVQEPDATLPDTAPPPVADAPKSPAVPDTSPQDHGQITDAQAFAAAESRSALQWIGLTQNGESGAQTTTELYLTFSDEVDIRSRDIDSIEIEDGKATPISFSFIEETDLGYRHALSIELHESVANNDIITVILEGVPNLASEPAIKSVMVYVATDASRVELALNALEAELLLGSNPNADEITNDLDLPDSNAKYDCDIVWSSQYPEIISNTGTVTRPEYGEENRRVRLTATVKRGEEAREKDFFFTVLEKEEEIVPAPPEPEIVPDLPEPEITPDPPKPEVIPAPSQPEVVPVPPENAVENPALPAVTSSQSSISRTSSNSESTSAAVQAGTSLNVDQTGALNRTAMISELQSVLQDTGKRTAALRAKNAQSVSPATLKAIAAAAAAEKKKAVIYADTMSQPRKVDARLYLTPASLTSVTEPIKLGIATRGERPETIKRFFDKHFENAVSVISCEQKGSFGAKLQIAAKVDLPKDIGNLSFYSYNAETNRFSRILTAYRLDANGFLRFATEAAGDIIISDGALKKR